jgi:hypothetical protein
MVGTVRQEGVVWALLNAKEGTIHRVRVGNYIGKNYGKVVNIVDNKIELVEIFADSSGAWRERKAAVTMADQGDKINESVRFGVRGGAIYRRQSQTALSGGAIVFCLAVTSRISITDPGLFSAAG